MISNIHFSNCNINNIVYHFPEYKGEIDKKLEVFSKNYFDNVLKKSKPFIPARDEYIFNQMIETFEERKQQNIPFSLNSLLKKFHFNPHRMIYSKWMKQCKMLNHFELATAIFKHFKSNNTIDKRKRDYLIIYSIFIGFCGKHDRPDLVLFHFNELENFGIKPDTACYAILIGVLGKNQRWDLCLFYYKRMRKLGIKLDQRCYCALIKASGRNHRPKLALFFWEKMKKEKMSIDDLRTLAIVVDSLSWSYPSLEQLEKRSLLC